MRTVQGGRGQSNTKRKGIVPVAHFDDSAIGRLSLLGHDEIEVVLYFGVDPTTDSLTVLMNVAPWRPSTWSPPPPCKMHWMD